MKINLKVGDIVVYESYGTHIGEVSKVNKLTGIATVKIGDELVVKHQDVFQKIILNR